MPDLEGHDLLPEDEIRFEQEDDWWVAHHEPSNVASQGKTREKAHEMVTEAVLLHRGEIGEPIETWEEEKELLREIGMTDEEIQEIKETRDEGANELPEFLQ